jgi:hypothetical protein
MLNDLRVVYRGHIVFGNVVDTTPYISKLQNRAIRIEQMLFLHFVHHDCSDFGPCSTTV